MSLLDDLTGDRPAPVPTGPSRLPTVEALREATAPTARDSSSHAVPDSADLQRILALPRRPPPPVEDPTHPRVVRLVERVTAKYARTDRSPPRDGASPACNCASVHRRPCIRTLSPAQAWALDEIERMGGLIGPIPVGTGKTGLGILAPMALPGCRTAVLLIPPNLREQLKREYDLWSQHFRVPSIRWDKAGGAIVPGRPVIHVVPYSLFSRPTSTALLESIRPDVIIADEGQKLRDRGTSTTGRVVRYMVEHPETRFLSWSGTITKGSITDYAHLAAFALRENSPVPLDPQVAVSWATAIDPIPNPAPPGKLRLLGPGPVQEVYGQRLTESPGWVAPRASSVANGLVLREREVELPPGIVKALAKMRGTWTRPDGEELVDVLQLARSARELACGFFYRWRFPRGEPEELIRRWFAARKSWHRELRERLKSPRPHLDSEHLATVAAERALAHAADGRRRPGNGLDLEDPERPAWWTYSFEDWKAVRDLVQPVPDTVWLDRLPRDFVERAEAEGVDVPTVDGADYLVRDAADWSRHHRGVVWYEHEAFGARLESDHEVVRHAGGPGAEARILAERGNRSIAASVKAHGTGRDGLQRLFATQLIVSPPASGDAWEQLLGRLHRIGQDADEVEAWVYRHTPELVDAFDQACDQARYTKATIGTDLKLL